MEEMVYRSHTLTNSGTYKTIILELRNAVALLDILFVKSLVMLYDKPKTRIYTDQRWKRKNYYI